MSISRRTFLLASGAVMGSAALTACGSGGLPDASSASGELEVFSWWTEGAERTGLEALLASFEVAEPDVRVVNRAVAGGAGVKAKEELASRLSRNNPPDSFQGHAGAELSDYISSGKLEDLTFLYDEQGWRKSFPERLLPLITSGDRFYSVPVNIHRANMLWSRPAILQAVGASPRPKSIEAWLGDLQKLRTAGKIPLVTGEPWISKHLLETVLLGSLGPQGWTALWAKGADWSSPEVTQALKDFGSVLSFADDGGGARTWEDGAKLVAEGKAGYQVMGDWAEPTLQGVPGMTAGEDYVWAATPGSTGVFQFLSDSFTLPKGAKHRAAAVAWLKACGSLPGQLSFNGAKGSIPALTGISENDRALFGDYLRWSLDAWSKDSIVGSLTHGVVASNAWNAAIDTALATFVKDRQVRGFQNALVAAAKENAPA